ncbi:MAG: methyltransferase domain-containing protein [Elusimicrobia bacterium]|nr:methyltransferase domain-containing protein [Elusimicrobiota bacterium]
MTPPREWWKRAFVSGVYPLPSLVDSLAFQRRTRMELPFLRHALRLRPGTALLDVCCGVGRHSLPLAKAGVAVTGLDVSPVYLREARRRARGTRAAFVKGDARRMPFSGRFDAAINMWTSFGYFAKAADDLAMLRSVRRALKPGGLFVLDTINGGRIARVLELQETLGLDSERWVEMQDGTLVLEDPRVVGGTRVRTRWIFIRGTRRSELVTDIRLYTGRSLSALARRAGLEVLRVYGETARRPYTEAASRRVVLIARRPSPRTRPRRAR